MLHKKFTLLGIPADSTLLGSNLSSIEVPLTTREASPLPVCIPERVTVRHIISH